MEFIENKTGGLLYMTAPNIEAVHAFSTRYGGVSSGYLSSLNLGEHCGDDDENVRKNYEILCSALDIDLNRLVFSHQVHKDGVKVASESDCHVICSPIEYDADALITDKVGLPLVIFSADCIPVLLYDSVKRVIGAVHCGWRGTVMDIAGKAVMKMNEVYGCEPKDIRAAIGAGISVCCFETDANVPEAVMEVIPERYDEFVFPKGEKFMVDLKGINRALLERAGVLSENISVSDECTMCLHEKYWSHRYTRGKRGLQCAVIMLRGNEVE